MRASIVIAVLNSHEVVRRQILHFENMPLPEDVELIIVDDGSSPPIEVNGHMVYKTNDFRPWTQPEARNKGVEFAKGEYVICTDIDHILVKETIETVLNTKYDVVRFKRCVGVLDENGDFSMDREMLEAYGYPRNRGERISAHGNSYAIKRELFLKLGGSQQKDSYPNRDEVPLKRHLKRMAANGEISIIPDDERPYIYMIPNGRFCGDKDYNPFGLFHNLKR
jgi:glycosyltransferase involved in cell wall biosynthesis